MTASVDDRRLRAELMSSFAKVGEAASNTSLLKGQPEIPPGCCIPALDELPAFASAYRECRAAPLPAPLFECEYEIVPSHDINGVGLLYLAAYPAINGICAARYARRSLAAKLQHADARRVLFRQLRSRRDVDFPAASLATRPITGSKWKARSAARVKVA